MAEAANAEKTAPKKKSWWKGVKSEFKKIIWPDRQTLQKETIAVIIISIILGVLIAALDYIIKFGVDFIIV